jgi:hypothetical protein
MISLLLHNGGLTWSKDPESYAGSILASVRVPHAGQFTGDDPYERDSLVLQLRGLDRQTCPVLKFTSRKPQSVPRPGALASYMGGWMDG